MRRRPLILAALLAALFALAGAACSTVLGDEFGGQDEEAPPTSQGPRPDEPNGEGGGGQLPPQTPADPLEQAVAGLGGRLAMTRGTELWVTAPDGSNPIRVEGGDTLAASQPVWSPFGLLAWVSLSDEGHFIRVGNGAEAGAFDSASVPGFPAFYLSWSGSSDYVAYIRSTDPESSEAVDLGALEAGAIGFDVAERVTSDARVVGRGAPIFLSWNDEDRLATTTDSGHVQLVAPDSEAPTTVQEAVGDVVPPAWIDENTLLIGTERGIEALNVTTAIASGGTGTVIVAGSGQSQFILNPNRTKLAFMLAMEGDSTDDSPPLRVLDLETGDTTIVVASGAFAWEWARGGERLAYLAPSETGSIDAIGFDPAVPSDPEPVQQQTTNQVRWFFWEGDVLLNATPPFIPSATEAGAYLPFFTQYAQSHNRWAPSGDGFAFAGTVNGQSGIWVQLVGAPVVPYFVDAGDTVTWSIDGGAGGTSIV